MKAWKNKKENDEQTNSIEDFGLSIIPVSSMKTPFKPWKIYQSKVASIDYWHNHYQNQGTVGIITGRISGNLEIIDVDVKNDNQRTIMTEYSDLIPDNLLQKLLIQTTPNNGFHLMYKCPDVVIEANHKLALEDNGEVIIETRGEGGYVCTNKINNKIIQGNFDLENLNINIPIITKEERQLLLETARSLTRYFPIINTKNNEKEFKYSEPAINDFNDQYNIKQLFEKHDWSVVKEDDEKYYLLRNGSLATHSGYYFKDKKTFFCFSTSTPFKPDKPYNHFQVLQVLEGNNDYRTTLRLLPNFGYEISNTSSKQDKITNDNIAEFLNTSGVRYDTLIQDLTLNGKIIEEMDYNTLFIDLKKHFEKEIPRTRFEETIKSNYIETINPLMDFINKHKDRQPQGTFEKWLDCMVLKNKSIDKDIVLKYLKKWYVGMIAQALDYDYPNEFFLTLISTEQGVGKTSLLRNHTLPVELQPYRKEHSLSFDDDFKVMMSQALLIIDDEMDGRTYEADKTFKNILSNKELTMRRKYDRRISTIKRRCSFAGSGNNLFIVREQQNRRIIPIEIEKIYFEKLGEMDLIDLFMEAYYLLVNGCEYSYQSHNKQELHHLYADYVQHNDNEMIIDELINHPENNDDIYYITSLDLVGSMVLKYPNFSKRINTVSIGKIMSEKGYEISRKGRSKTVCYAISKSSKIIIYLTDEKETIKLNPNHRHNFNHYPYVKTSMI